MIGLNTEKFIQDEGKNIYLIQIKEQSLEKIMFTLQDYEFSVTIKEKKFFVEALDDFLEDWMTKVNKKCDSTTDITELLQICTKEFGILIGDEEEDDELIFESNLENDNFDLKFVDRIRFGEDDFNPDLFVNIFEFLSGFYLIHFRRVSKLWKDLIEKDSLWESIIKKEKIESQAKMPLYKIFILNSRKYLKWNKIYTRKETVQDFQFFISDKVTTGVQKMNIKLISFQKLDTVVFGITDVEERNSHLGHDTESFGYYYNGQKYNKQILENYGEAFKEGDVVTIIVDCGKMELMFEMNGKPQGVAYKIPKLPVYFAISADKALDNVYEILK